MKRADWTEVNAHFVGKRIAWPTLAILAADLGLSVLAWMLVRQSIIGLLPAFILQSVAFLHLYLIHHEAVHGLVFPRASQNRWLGRILGFILVYPFGPRQQLHMAHHRWTGHPEGDPTNRRLIAHMAAQDKEGQARLNRLWNRWLPFFAWREKLALWRLAAWGGEAGKAAVLAHPGAWLQLSAYAVLVMVLAIEGGLWTFLQLYVPAYCMLLILEEMVNLPHHTETPLINSSRPYEFWRQDEVTHSCRSVPFWSRWVLLNFNLHTAHHLFPTAAWYQLPKAHRLMVQAAGEVPMVVDELHWNLVRRRQPFMAVYAEYLASVKASRSAVAEPMVEVFP